MRRMKAGHARARSSAPSAASMESARSSPASPRPDRPPPPVSCRHICGDKSACRHKCCNRWIIAAAEWYEQHPPDPVRHALPVVGAPVFRDMQKFFDTQEMFETALQYLSPAELLNAKGVNKHWRTTIEGKAFDKAMFLAADETPNDAAKAADSGRVDHYRTPDPEHKPTTRDRTSQPQTELNARPFAPPHAIVSATINDPVLRTKVLQVHQANHVQSSFCGSPRPKYSDRARRRVYLW